VFLTKLPAMHFWQTEALNKLKLPALQGRHLTAPDTASYRPAAQPLHPVKPVAASNFPAAQAVQLAEPVVAAK